MPVIMVAFTLTTGTAREIRGSENIRDCGEIVDDENRLTVDTSTFSKEEKNRGFIAFGARYLEPVYPNTVPPIGKPYTHFEPDFEKSRAGSRFHLSEPGSLENRSEWLPQTPSVTRSQYFLWRVRMRHRVQVEKTV